MVQKEDKKEEGKYLFYFSYTSFLTSYTLKICSTLATHPKYTFGSLSPLKVGKFTKGKEVFGDWC